jgi:hypothetical protein
VKPQPPLDSDTYNRAHNIIVNARRLGTDPVEELQRHGLLLTPAREKELRISVMEFLLREITSWRPAEFLRMKFLPHHSASPADLYSCVVEFVEKHIAAARRGP